MKLTTMALAALVAAAMPAPAAPAPKIALTFDDLPVHGPIPAGDTPQTVADTLIEVLRREHVKAYGFVNARWTAEQPATIEALEHWRAAGLPLGNHTWSHRHLSEMSTSQFEEEVAADEPVLQRLAGESDWHWLRYPYLDEGKDAAQTAAARKVLSSRGYKIADVTMDFSDWQWTAPYARCRAAHDEASIAELERLYVSAARDAISFYRGLSHQLYNRDIPYVILLHESAFEARMLPQLIHLFRSAGFRFVTLQAAESDPYYKDRLDPALPAGPAGLVNHAFAAGLKPRPYGEFAPKLAAVCTTAASTAASP